MAEVILDVGDAAVAVDVVTAKVAVTTPSTQVHVESPQAAVGVTVETPAVVVSAPQDDIVVYSSNPNVTVDLVGKEGPAGPPGPPGPVGPPGSGGIATVYVHSQAVLSPTWVVEHNMGKHPVVTCEDGAGSIITGSVTYVDDNSLLVGFAFSITGRANCT